MQIDDKGVPVWRTAAAGCQRGRAYFSRMGPKWKDSGSLRSRRRGCCLRRTAAMLTDALEATDWSIYCPSCPAASPLCPCNDPLLHAALIYACSCLLCGSSLWPSSPLLFCSVTLPSSSSSSSPSVSIPDPFFLLSQITTKLFNFFIHLWGTGQSQRRLLATDHLLGMEIATKLACPDGSGGQGKKLSSLPRVCAPPYRFRASESPLSERNAPREFWNKIFVG